jgi:hypothetical protein
MKKTVQTWRQYVNGLISAEISTLSRYYDRLIQIRPREGDSGLLRDAIDSSNKSVVQEICALPDMTSEREQRSIVLLNGSINHDFDIQGTLNELRAKLSRSSRVIIVAYNPYFRWLYALANRFGIRKGEMPTTFLTRTALNNTATISQYRVERIRPCVYLPIEIPWLSSFLNSVLPALPIIKWLSLTTIVTLRPVIADQVKPSLSIVIPARNERGNIENALKRIPAITGNMIEVIFVEGHSRDGTWEEIQRVAPLYSDRFKIQTMQQTGKGKSDAVRLGFSKATGEIITILDADLTMPPELLGRFYDAYCEGHGDFINGSRLVYPMEGQAMRFLNHIGNVFFAKALSEMLDATLSDSLCGTKLLARSDYERMVRWRSDFGDFDPFGDFELLFPAAILGLGIIDIPIRYRDRTYGSTQIRRFYHGLMLLRMTAIGFLRVKMGRPARLHGESAGRLAEAA